MSDDAGATSIKLFGIFVAARIVGFLGLVYFARVLPQEELGVYFLFYLVVQVASLVSNLGLRESLVTRIGEGKREDAAFSAALGIVSLASLGVAALVIVFRGPLAAYVGADVPVLIAVATASWLISDIHNNGLQAEDRVLASGVLQFGQDLLRVLAGAAFISAGFGATGIMYGVIVGFVGSTVIGRLLTDLSVVVPEREDFRRLFSVSRYTMVFGPTNFAYFWLDTFMIGLLLTRAGVSSYEVAWQTTRVLIIATTAINTTIFPKVSRWAADGRLDEIERVLPGAILFSVFFPIPGLVGLVVLGPEILGLVYRPAYAEAAIPLAILGVYMLVEAIQRISNSVLTALDRPDIPYRSRLLGVGLAVALNVALIPAFGLVGAAVATLTAKLVDTVVQWRAMFSLLSVRVPLRSLTWEVFCALVMGIFLVGVTGYAAPTGLVELLALVAAGATLYGLLVIREADIEQVVEQYLPFRIPV